MIPKSIQEKLIEHKFHIDFNEGCSIYKLTFKTALFGEIDVDIFDGEGFKSKINIVKDCEDIIQHKLSVENIDMCVNEIKKLEKV
jgi:hypothetical protein